MSRKRSSIPKRERVFVGCEGSSERSYGRLLDKLSKELGLHLHFETRPKKGGGGDHLIIIEKSIEERQKGMKFGRYVDSIIFVDDDSFGRDLAKDQQAINLCAQNDIRLLRQRPNFEGFLLRHFPGCENMDPHTSRVMRSLLHQWPDYDKPETADSLRQKISFDDIRRVCGVEDVLNDFLENLGFPV